MRMNECSCGCGGTSTQCNQKELDSYMFFGNLQIIKRSIDALMQMSPAEVDAILNDGHDWAADHVATSKDDLQEVADFFINKMSHSNGDSHAVLMMGEDPRLRDAHAMKTFESFLTEGKKAKNKKKKTDQDNDGDSDFADAKVAQYMAGGMSRAEAIAKSRKFNKMNELNRATYDRAADIASARGYKKLASRFKEHGREFGMNQDLGTVSMVVRRGHQAEYRVRVLSLERDENFSQGFIMKAEDSETGRIMTFMINKYSDAIEFFLNGDYPAMPETRADARKILNAFMEMGEDVSGLDPRAFSFNDSGF